MHGGGDHGASTAAELDHAFVAQLLVGPQHRVQVDVERGSELPGAGQPLAVDELAVRDGGAHLSGALREQRVGRPRSMRKSMRRA